MFTKTQAEEFNLSYGTEVRFLSRMTAKNLNVVYGRTLREMGREVLFGGPSGKDELISAILELHGMGIDKLNEASHVLYHSEDMPNEACKFCSGPWIVRYEHMRGYMVRRTFPNRAKADEFISVNAMVHPLPCMSLHGPGELQFSEDTSNHFPSTEDADGF
jgi:hypothetical protein